MTTKADIYAELKELRVTLTSSQLKKISKPALQKRLDEKRAGIRKAPKSSTNVVPIKKPAAVLNRPPKPALAFKPARPGTKRALMAEAVLRPGGATLDALMNLTGWDRNTTSGAIIWDLCSQMGMGVRREGDRYHGSLPEGGTSAVRDVAPVRAAPNSKK